jgi:hypothetical protein
LPGIRGGPMIGGRFTGQLRRHAMYRDYDADASF